MHSICIPSRVTARNSLDAHVMLALLPSTVSSVAGFEEGSLSFKLWFLEENWRVMPESGRGTKSFLNIHPTTDSLLYSKGIRSFATSVKLTAVWLRPRHEVGSPGNVLSWCRRPSEGLLSPDVQWNGSHRSSGGSFGKLRPQWWLGDSKEMALEYGLAGCCLVGRYLM